MSSLAQSFLDDFDNEEIEEENELARPENGSKNEDSRISEDTVHVLTNKLKLSIKAIESDKGFESVLTRIRELNGLKPDAEPSPKSNADDLDYELVVKANKFCARIDEKLLELFELISDAYALRFPELVSHVPEPLTYLKVVKLLGNAENLNVLESSSIISSAQIMALLMTGSKLTTSLLSQELLDVILYGCDLAVKLANLKSDLLVPFVSNRMPRIAPNVVALIGSDVSAQLLGMTGGLFKLSSMPANNILVVGRTEKALHGFAEGPSVKHFGILYDCLLVQECSAPHRKKAMRTVAGRVSLAARVDCDGRDKNGSSGKLWYEEIRDKLTKWHAPPPGKAVKPLPAPITDGKKQRGGRSRRRFKEIYGDTVVRKQINRMAFGDSAEEYGDSAMGKSFGMLGKEGSGSARLYAKETKQSQPNRLLESKPMEQKVKNRKLLMSELKQDVLPAFTSTLSLNSDSATQEKESDVAFVVNEGIAIVNPAAAQKNLVDTNEKYFGGLSFKRTRGD